MGTTPTYSWPYPEPTDPVANGAQDIEDLALAVETTVSGLPEIGLALISRTAIGSAVSSITVTDAFSVDYDNYLIVYKIDAGSTTSGLTLVFGVGASMTTTGYYEGRLTINNAGAVSGAAANNAASFDLNSVSSTAGGSGSIEVFRPYAVALTGTYSVGSDMRTIGAPMRTQSGWQNSTTQFTSFQIAASTGTITGGSIDLYGYRGV
jgi:hypothetical protein